MIFSSPEPKAHGELLGSPVVRRPSCVLCRQQLLQMTSSLEQLSGFQPNLAEMILIRHSSLIVKMVSVNCISKSAELKIDPFQKNLKNLLL